MTHASCKANKVMTDTEHSLETSHNVQKWHDHEEQTKSDENGYIYILSVSTWNGTMRMKWVCLCGRVLYRVVEG